MVPSFSSTLAERWRLDRGIAAARRHTRRVRYLRASLIAALALQGALALAFVAPASHRFASADSRRTLISAGVGALAHAAKVSGRFSDGSRFDVSARSAVIGTSGDLPIALANVDFDFQEVGASHLRIRAKRGAVDQIAETLSLDHGVEILGPNERKLGLESLVIDLRDGKLKDALPSADQNVDGPAAMILALVLSQRQMLAAAR